jgi:hypothetical protein
MMRRLRDLGLKPEQVPPHKDSFFLSLMKSLQRAGLRPTGYDFREGAVLGAERQFPDAAKRARFDVLKLLSSQADKLNGIGGWKLSSEEFQRYFAKSWWTLPAARDDLFMASAHLYSVRIVVFSIEPERLDEQVSLDEPVFVLTTMDSFPDHYSSCRCTIRLEFSQGPPSTSAGGMPMSYPPRL